MNAQRSTISEQDFVFSQEVIGKLSNYFSRRVVGQEGLKYSLIASIIADGHVLIESVPGLAKTTAAKAIADAVPDLPVLLYNNPGRVGYGMSAALIRRLAHEVDNIVGMKDTSGDMTLTEEVVRQNRDVDFKVFGGKDTLLYVSLCIGAVGGVCTAGNFMPELIGDIYKKYTAGDIAGALEAQFKLNPVRLSMDAASFPVAAKDMANLRSLDVGDPYLPNLPTAEGPVLEKIRKAMQEAGLI